MSLQMPTIEALRLSFVFDDSIIISLGFIGSAAIVLNANSDVINSAFMVRLPVHSSPSMAFDCLLFKYGYIIHPYRR